MENVPIEIREAALLVGNWMKENGHKDWKMYDIADRNLVTEAGEIVRQSIADLKKMRDADCSQAYSTNLAINVKLDEYKNRIRALETDEASELISRIKSLLRV